jgi:arginyl-tRNA synthetase
VKDDLHEQIRGALRALLDAAGDAGPLPEFALDPPRQAEHGDFACNAAMVLAKRLAAPPREIAASLIERLGDAGGLVDRAEVAGPGFVNLWLGGGQWQGLLRDILAAGSRYGSSDEGKHTRVQVEFVSANPTGPLSTGHGRQGVLGDCVARLLEFTGHDVMREYYFNNGGRQMRVLGESVRARYLESLGRAAPPPASAFEEGASWPEEIDGLPVVFPADGYQGDYIAEIADALRAECGEALVDEPGDGRFRERAERDIFAGIRATLDSIGIEFDVYSNEKALYDEGKIDEVLADLRSSGLVYDEDEAVWLRATELGLDRDRVLVKRTGEPTYMTPDIAYHREKLRRGFDRVIDVQGADHKDQFPFVLAGLRALGLDPDRVELVMHQFVTVTSGGRQVKQSTRRATFITVDELVEQIGADVFRFFMIERKAEGHLDFDLDLAKERDWKKNPAYYVQYAHARTAGVERKAAEQGMRLSGPDGFEPARLELPEEIDLVKKLGEFPELVARAAGAREPHHVAYYLRELAGLWNPYLQDGKRHRVVSDEVELSYARLGLSRAVRTVLANGLGLLGIQAPEAM